MVGRHKFLSNFHLQIETAPNKETYQKYKSEVQKLLKSNNIKHKEIILEQIKKLNTHHHKTIIHCLMVAKDVKYIATKLNLPKDKISKLTLAAYIHDIGKINIINTILNLKGKEELTKIWKYSREKKPPITNHNLIKKLTIIEIIKYKASTSSNKTKYLKDFYNWWNKNNLPKKYLQLTIYEYIKLHQQFTKEILNRAGMDKDIIEYASSHHSWYLPYKIRKKIPQETKIIEISDRFNAIAQTEGMRPYTHKKSRIEALITIINEILYTYKIKKDIFIQRKTFEKQIIYTLILKYFPEEINNFLKPQIEPILEKSRKNNINMTIKNKQQILNKTKQMIIIINNIIEINNLFSKTKIEHYNQYKNYIRQIIYLKNSQKELKEFSKKLKKNLNHKNQFATSIYLNTI